MSLRRRPHVVDTAPALQHYLATGCWASGEGTSEDRFETFLLAGHVLRHSFHALRQAWERHRDAVKSAYPGETFAEATLAGDGDDWIDARSTCPEHRV